MNGETLDISTLVAIGGLILTLIALTGGVLYRLGQLSSRVDQLDRRFDEMTDEMREDSREIREDIRRNHQQLLQALAHHSQAPPGKPFSAFRPGRNRPGGGTISSSLRQH